MLRLNVVVQNPAAASALDWFGVVLFVLLAALVVALWIVVARGRARRNVKDFDDSASDRGLQALRHRRLVVRPARKPRGSQAAVVAELDPIAEPEPTGLKRSP